MLKSIVIDKKAGFCAGVKRAINLVEDELSKTKKVFALGDLIHNRREMERLANCGLEILAPDVFKNKDENYFKGKTIIIRAHGEKKEVFELAKKLEINIIDGTCPIVKKLQNQVKKAHEEGYQIVVVGKREHPEIIGLKGQFEGSMEVILNSGELTNLNPKEKTAIFAQTTISEDIFDKIVSDLNKKFRSLVVYKTICKSVLKRKKEIESFLTEIDTLIFVGGKNSSNTNVLFQAFKDKLSNSYFIEDENEIELSWFMNSCTVGISGSASTPKWQMKKAKIFLKQKNTKKVEATNK